MFKQIIKFSFTKPKVVLIFIFVLVLLSLIQFPKIKVDTDPENMLSKKEFVRVFHHKVKKEFGIFDFIVLGIINEENNEGVFNVETLNKIYQITEEIKKIEGIIQREIIAPSTKDNIRQGETGSVIFEWLMPELINTEEEAVLIRNEAKDNPMFNGTLVSEDGKALCLYIPIEQKSKSYEVSKKIDEIVRTFPGNEKYHITGLPVAEDTFGVEMFKQMAISAPMAGLVIFLLMFFFFKNIKLIFAPMLLAIATVIMTMGLLIAFKFPVHIMSSMIPIFLMPIAVLDSVHILSEFFDKYSLKKNKGNTLDEVMDELFTPMLYTSLTSGIGFFSLSFSPIPPVQTFGVFVAIGVMIAWILTLTFIPAYIALIKEEAFKGIKNLKDEDKEQHGFIDKFLMSIKNFSLKRSKIILVFSVLVSLISIYGITKIKANDNPVKWFTKNHSIRIADKVLNEHFGGTYTAYLVLEAEDKKGEVFKEPRMLEYIENLQKYLIEGGTVGKSTSITDVVKKVYYELLGGDKINNVVPKTKRAVAQCLISYENSHKPDDLWHLTTPDFSKVNIWIQLKSGDNKDMNRVTKQVEKYFNQNTLPFELNYNWAGLTYINLVWQNKMVLGMLKNFLGSFIIVFFMMTFLFKSPVRGLISMIPLTVTILFIYSFFGFTGKDYDMPVAVLSALTLGLSIDFAIHFIQRARDIFAVNADENETINIMYRGPARAIIRNSFVIAIGFLPLLFASLVPYRTVGLFMFFIMFVSSMATLFILPAIMTVFPKIFFKEEEKSILCNCKYCFIVSIAVSLIIVYFLKGYTTLMLRPSLLISIVFVALMGFICSKISKIKICIKLNKEDK